MTELTKCERRVKCFVPTCRSSKKTTPDKIFIHVPVKAAAVWCKIVGRSKVPRYNVYCCEDHFNLQEDIFHYEVLALAGGRKRIKRGVVPRFNLGQSTTSDSKAAASISASASTSNEVPIRLLNSDASLSQVQTIKQENPDSETEAVKSENCDYEMSYSEQCKEERMEDDERSDVLEVVETKPRFEEVFVPEASKVVDDALVSLDLNKSTQTYDSLRAVQCKTRNMATQTCIEQNSIGVSAEFDDTNKIFK